MKKVMRVLLSAAVLGSLLSGCQNTQTAAEASPAVEETAEVARSTVEAWGAVSAETIKEIHIDFPAFIEDVFVREGQQVKKGDKLLSMNYEDYKASIARKEKELSLEKAKMDGEISSSSGSVQQINNLQQQISSKSARLSDGSDTDIAALQAEIEANKAKLPSLEKDLEVKKELVEAEVGAQKDVDDLQIQIDEVKINIGTLEQRIINLKKDKNLEIDNLKSNIAELKDKLSETEKANQSAINTYAVNQDLSKLDIQLMKDKYARSFIEGNDIVLDIPNGIIKSVKVVEGSQVDSNSGALLEILDEDSVIVKANVSEEFIKDVKLGQEVDIIPYADREAVIKGTVKEIESMAVNENGEVVIPVLIEASEESPYLRYGYSVDVEIYTD